MACMGLAESGPDSSSAARSGPPPPVQAFIDRGVDFVHATSLRELNDQFTSTDNELVTALDNALRGAGFDGWGLKVYHPKATNDERSIYAPDPNPPKKVLAPYAGNGVCDVVRVDV